MIKLENVTKKEGKKTVISDFNFEVAKNEIVGILGKNSSGKTLLLDMIVGLKMPNSGKILIDGTDVQKDIFKTRRMIGYMSETPVYENMTVREYLIFMGKVRRQDDIESKLEKYLDIFALEEVENTLVSKISASETKKLAILGAYIGQPEIILLDEPFLGLEIADGQKIVEYIKKNKHTTIIATHTNDYLEDICDKVVIIDKGKIIKKVDIKELKKSKKELKDVYLELTK